METVCGSPEGLPRGGMWGLKGRGCWVPGWPPNCNQVFIWDLYALFHVSVCLCAWVPS